MNENNDNIYSLSDEICVQAGKDYKEALESIQSAMDTISKAKKVIAECEEFFKSEAFRTLSGGADGETIMKRIKEHLGVTYE